MHYTNQISQLVRPAESFIPKINKTIWRVGVSPWPYMTPECYQSPTPDCYAGIELEILEVIGQLLNVTFDFIITQVPGCGTYDSTVGWTGLKGLLLEGKIDITGNLCHVDYDETLRKFSIPSYPVARYKESYLIQQIQQHTYNAEIYGPFEYKVWCTIVSLGLIFIIFKTLLDKLTLNVNLFKSFWNCLNDAARLACGMDGPRKISSTWLVWICFAGCVTVLYSTYIKMALMKPALIHRPFGRNEEFAEVLFEGGYKLLDYRKNPRYKCYTPKTCRLLEESFSKQGFTHFRQPSGREGAAMTLNQLLLSNETLVFSKGNFLLRMDLDSFKDRHKLWMVDDDSSPEYFMSFLYARNLPLAPIIDKTIILLGNFPANRHNMRYGLWKNVLQGTVLKGNVPEFVPIEMWQIISALKFYSSFNTIATIVFTLEFVWYKFRPKDKLIKKAGDRVKAAVIFVE